MAELWKFGNYEYPKSIILDTSRSLETKNRFADTPGRHGQYTQGSLLAARRIPLKGHLIPEPADDMEALWDAFLAAHAPGLPRALYLGRDDRFINAEVISVADTEGGEYPTSIPWELSFIASDPTQYAASTTTTSITAGGTVTNAGNIETPPVISVVLSSIGSSGTLTLTNGSVSLVLAMPVATTTLTIDMARQRVTNTGGTDVTELVTSGRFWTLQPGNNTVARSFGGGASASSISSVHRERWY